MLTGSSHNGRRHDAPQLDSLTRAVPCLPRHAEARHALPATAVTSCATDCHTLLHASWSKCSVIVTVPDLLAGAVVCIQRPQAVEHGLQQAPTCTSSNCCSSPSLVSWWSSCRTSLQARSNCKKHLAAEHKQTQTHTTQLVLLLHVAMVCTTPTTMHAASGFVSIPCAWYTCCLG